MAMNPDWILEAPRQPLAFLPTPLVPLDRLSSALGGPRIWLKRDDCTGLATGGNKTRKLEYLLADALREQADTVVTFGAIQSNHARQTAAACAATGLPCHLLLARKVPWNHPHYETAGNVQLDRVLGAEVTLVAPDELPAAREALLARLDRDGVLPYLIPVGGSNAVGAMGYARCALELLEQSEHQGFVLTDVMHACSSAGTQAGLLAGFAGLLVEDTAPRPRVHGINVSDPDPAPLAALILQIAVDVLNARGLAASVTAADVALDSRYLGDGYGLPTPETLAAIRLLGRSEGVVMDPVYSGKAFAALVDRVRRGEFDHCRNLVFVHTGGVAAMGVYDQLL